MERLGILECDSEDFALATYVCPSKTEVSKIIAEGLELMEKEG
jgi:Na+-transporting NADH:ubiquinone oxidoreductase subunit A